MRDICVLMIQFLTKCPNSLFLSSDRLSLWSRQVYTAVIIISKSAQNILEWELSVQQKLLLLLVQKPDNRIHLYQLLRSCFYFFSPETSGSLRQEK